MYPMMMQHNKKSTSFDHPFFVQCSIVLLLVFSSASLAFAQALFEPKPLTLFESKVLKVIDGDTIRLEDGRVVRYLGVDAPELRKKVNNRWIHSPEPYAEEATAFNKSLVEGKKVLIEIDPAKQRDKFGRLAVYVYLVESKLLANEEIIKAGLAKAEKLPIFMKHRKRFWSIEEMAWHDKRGMWAESSTTP